MISPGGSAYFPADLERREGVEWSGRPSRNSGELHGNEEFPPFAGRRFPRHIFEVSIINKRHSENRDSQRVNRPVGGFAGADDTRRLNVIYAIAAENRYVSLL